MAMKITERLFGELPNGNTAKLFTFESENGLTVSITNYGGIITSIHMPDRHGLKEEICAGFDNLSDYLKGHPHFGVLVGRYANRIAFGKFAIDNKTYNLPINNGPNHLHGGNNGFHTKLWNYKIENEQNRISLILSHTSKHLEEGYPGNIDVNVKYTIADDNSLQIHFIAKTDMPTHVNLTSHGYFNLSGFKESVSRHKLMLDAKRYVEVNMNQIPTGRLVNCENTPFDFSEFKYLAQSIQDIAGGLDHCYELSNSRSTKSPAAILKHESTGRSITVYTTQPGIQIYTGNSLDGSIKGHNNTIYQKHAAVCLETQHFPDTPNHPNFPSTLLKPNEVFNHEVKYVFEVE
ncbi:MAG TPA: aldose epimerase family protein [Tenuifilaceae bacterium]|nr:aldose epimerase family protein [Tenuifilaceae bacterium]